MQNSPRSKNHTANSLQVCVPFVILTAILISCVLFAAVPRPLRAAQEKTMVFGVNPWGDPAEMRRMFRPIMDYLKEKTGITFRISVSPTYEQLVTDVGSGYVDLASLNAATYIKVKRKYPNTKYLATATKLESGETRTSYVGYIIVLRDSPFHSLEDLRGRRFAFVSTESNSGYKVPYAMMALKKLDPKTYFKKYFFVGDHDEVAKAVKNHCVEGGATWDNSYKINTKRFGNIFRIIQKTPNIPNDAWVASADMPAALAEKIKNILLATNADTKTADGRLALDPDLGFPTNGWSVQDQSLYDNAADVLLMTEGKK